VLCLCKGKRAQAMVQEAVERAGWHFDGLHYKTNGVGDVAPAIEAAKVGDIAAQLEDDVEWIERNRYEVCERDETSMQNTIDEVVELYHTTLYKLRMLK